MTELPNDGEFVAKVHARASMMSIMQTTLPEWKGHDNTVSEDNDAGLMPCN